MSAGNVFWPTDSLQPLPHRPWTRIAWDAMGRVQELGAGITPGICVDHAGRIHVVFMESGKILYRQADSAGHFGLAEEVSSPDGAKLWSTSTPISLSAEVTPPPAMSIPLPRSWMNLHPSMMIAPVDMEPVRTAIVGCGKVGQIHAEALRSLSESHVFAGRGFYRLRDRHCCGVSSIWRCGVKAR